MEEKDFRVVCPVCGNVFYNSDDSKAHIICNRCGSDWDIIVKFDELFYKLRSRGSKRTKPA